LSLSSNPGLELANAFGVQVILRGSFQTEPPPVRPALRFCAFAENLHNVILGPNIVAPDHFFASVTESTSSLVLREED